MTTILHVAASTRGDESATTQLATELLDRIGGDADIVTRRLVDGVAQLSIPSTAELASPVGERSPEADEVLRQADQLIAELVEADIVVFGAPIYNFGPPSSLKAWADLVARAGTTFQYTPTGPEGLLADRPVYIVAASGGTPIGSDIDFGTTWLRQFLNFLGITNITVVTANGLAVDPDAGIAEARAQIADLATAA